MPNASLVQTFEEVKLVYHNKTKAKDRPKLSNSNSVYQVFINSWDKDQISLLEEFKIALVDRQLRLMSIASISSGGTTGTVVDPKIVFALALRRRANSIFLAHNHPSGNLKPSQEDIRLTENLSKAGSFLDIKILDHIIVTPDGYYSMSNEGLML